MVKVMKTIPEKEIMPEEEIPIPKKFKEELTMMGVRVERSKWIDFTSKIRKERKKLWEVLEPFINEYLCEHVVDDVVGYGKHCVKCGKEMTSSNYEMGDKNA